jgi:pimeloyl-ACP methyl ester carboxylesterase
MQALSAEFRTYALDLWGFGDSGKRADRYTLDAQAEMIHGFMEQLGILKAAFVGHGLGGVVAARFATKYPDWADRMMAVSVPLTGAAINPRLLNSAPPGLVEWLLGRGPTVDSIGMEAAKTDAAAVEATVRSLMQRDLKVDLMELKSPCLLVYGEKDPAITPPDETSLNGVKDNVRRIGLEESRHFPMLDEASKFNRLLSDFLSLKSGEDLVDLGLKEEWRRRVR